MSTEIEIWFEKMATLRADFAAKYSNGSTAFICGKCKADKGIGQKFTYNTFGFKFHPECEPELVLPVYPK